MTTTRCQYKLRFTDISWWAADRPTYFYSQGRFPGTKRFQQTYEKPKPNIKCVPLQSSGWRYCRRLYNRCFPEEGKNFMDVLMDSWHDKREREKQCQTSIHLPCIYWVSLQNEPSCGWAACSERWRVCGGAHSWPRNRQTPPLYAGRCEPSRCASPAPPGCCERRCSRSSDTAAPVGPPEGSLPRLR